MLTFGILGEDISDAEALAVIVRKLAGSEKLPIRKKGYDGCQELLRKGAHDLRAWTGLGVSKFIVCHDADRNSPDEIRQRVLGAVVTPTGLASSAWEIVIPVQELEAWILADNAAIKQVIQTWSAREITSPERQDDPKEFLVGLCRKINKQPLYFPAVHNRSVAKHLDLDVVLRKCPSFEPLAAFVRKACEGAPQ